jgi:hypothetical protein
VRSPNNMASSQKASPMPCCRARSARCRSIGGACVYEADTRVINMQCAISDAAAVLSSAPARFAIGIRAAASTRTKRQGRTRRRTFISRRPHRFLASYAHRRTRIGPIFRTCLSPAHLLELFFGTPRSQGRGSTVYRATPSPLFVY